MTPTRRAAGLVLVVAGLGVLLPLTAGPAALLLAGVAGIILADAAVAVARRPTGTRTRPATLARERPVPFEIEVSVPGAGAVEIRQPVPPELALTPSRARGTRLEGTLVGRHRGRHTVGPALVRATGPLGLGRRDRAVDGDLEVTVFPDLPGARRLEAARRQGRSTEEGRIRSRLGLGTEFETIRDYSPDDDVRQINWVATARVGRPMSNQYRVDENRDLLCVVDGGRLMAGPLGSATRLDVALDAVAALAVAADEAGDRVGTVAFASTVSRVLAPRRRGAEAVVRSLFDLEPEETESAYHLAFQAVAGRKRALVALFTDLMDEAAARSLLDALPVLLRRHAVMVVSCRDPDLSAAASGAHHRVLDVHRTSVALEFLASRERAVDHLRAVGAVVIEADPDRLGAAAVGGYLRLKARGRL